MRAYKIELVVEETIKDGEAQFDGPVELLREIEAYIKQGLFLKIISINVRDHQL